MLIPDSVYGAVLLSVIDFFLSFLAISVIGFVQAFFPYSHGLASAAGVGLRKFGALISRRHDVSGKTRFELGLAVSKTYVFETRKPSVSKVDFSDLWPSQKPSQ